MVGDGAPVAAFGAGGRVTADFHPGVGDTCADLTVGPSGNLVAVGSTNARGFVVAYRADGTRDPSFAGGSTVELGTAFAALSGITIAPDGDIVTVGRIFREDGLGLRDDYKISGPELETMCDLARSVPVRTRSAIFSAAFVTRSS